MPAPTYIPKIEYKNITITGDTHASTTLDDIASTTGIEVGMVCEGSGIPTGTTVTVVGANSVTLSAAATTSLNNASFEFFHLVEFSYPPMEDIGEQYDAKERRSVSISGLTQVSIDHTEITRKQKYRFITPTLLTTITTFFNNHGKLGESFRFYESKEIDSYVTYELAKYELKPKRILYKAGVSGFLHDLELNYRRVA